MCVLSPGLLIYPDFRLHCVHWKFTNLRHLIDLCLLDWPRNSTQDFHFLFQTIDLGLLLFVAVLLIWKVVLIKLLMQCLSLCLLLVICENIENGCSELRDEAHPRRQCKKVSFRIHGVFGLVILSFVGPNKTSSVIFGNLGAWGWRLQQLFLIRPSRISPTLEESFLSPAIFECSQGGGGCPPASWLQNASGIIHLLHRNLPQQFQQGAVCSVYLRRAVPDSCQRSGTIKYEY